MLLVNISAAEIQQLNYERFHYPCPIIQKRIHAVYLKATLGMSNATIGQIAGLHAHFGESLGKALSQSRV